MANNRPKSDCKGDSIYPWSCSQIELKCTTMTQPLICEYVRRSGGTVSLNRMPHRNNHLIYEAEGSPLTWFHSSLFCTCTFCPELLTHFGKCYGYLLHSLAVTAAVISVFFFFPPKKKGSFYFHLPTLTDSLVKHILQSYEVLDQFDSWYIVVVPWQNH